MRPLLPVRACGALLGATLLCSTQNPLTRPITTTQPCDGVAGVISCDGDTLYQAQGPWVVGLDLTRVRQNELSGGSWTLDDIETRGAYVDSSILDFEEAGGRLYVAGGDEGIFHIGGPNDTSPAQVLDDTGGGRWCFDIVAASDAAQDEYLLALWAGYNTSQLRIYHVSTGTTVATVPLDVGAGLTRRAAGFALATAPGDPYVYAAMGTSGLVRVNWQQAQGGPPFDVQQGPLAEDFFTTREDADPYRSRDLVLVDGELIVAADANGLQVFDVTAPATWGPSMPASQAIGMDPVEPSESWYPVRVDALKDGEGNLVLAVATLGSPSAWRESQNRVQYGNWDWAAAPYPVNRDNLPTGSSAVFVLERRPVDALIRARHKVPAGRGVWNTIDLDVADGSYWLYDDRMVVWNFRRALGVLTAPVRSDELRYEHFRSSYSEGTVSRLDPSLLLSGLDTGKTPPEVAPLVRVVAGTVDPDFDNVFPTDPGPDGRGHKLGLFARDSWVSSLAQEWVPSMAQGEYWKFSRLDITPGVGVDAARSWIVPYPEQSPWDPHGYGGGRVDPRPGTDVLALNLSGQKRDLYFYAKSEVAQQIPSAGGGLPAELTSVVLYPEAPNLTDSNEAKAFRKAERLPTYELEYWVPPDPDDPTLLFVAAGHFVRSSEPEYEHAKLAVLNIDGLTGPIGVPSTIPIDYGVGAGRRSDAMGVEVADVGGTVYAFVSESGGNVSAFELTSVQGQVDFVATWPVPRGKLDNRRTALSDVVYRQEDDGHFLYVAANRYGVIRLEFVVPLVGAPYFVDAGRLNTPFQALGLELATFVLDFGQGPVPTEVLLVHDHGGGIRMYAEQ